MQTNRLKEGFSEYLTQGGVDLQQLDAPTAVARMLRWYESMRVDDAIPVDQDGDMLLLQWGTSDRGQGDRFRYNITRQVIRRESVDDDEIWQLGLTLQYKPSDATERVGSGNRWCPTPADVEELRTWVAASDSAKLSARLDAEHVDLRFGCAG